MTRKTITVDEAVFERLEALKGNESWSTLLDRLADADESQDGDVNSTNASEPLTVDHIPDIANRTTRQTADELENRLTGR